MYDLEGYSRHCWYNSKAVTMLPLSAVNTKTAITEKPTLAFTIANMKGIDSNKADHVPINYLKKIE